MYPQNSCGKDGLEQAFLYDIQMEKKLCVDHTYHKHV